MQIKTADSLGRERFKPIGQAGVKKIIKGISDYSTRAKLKSVAAGLGTSRVSFLKLAKSVSKNQGRAAADKFIRAGQAEFNDKVNPDIQKRFMKINMQRDEAESFGAGRPNAYAGGRLASKSAGVGGQKGEMNRIGVNRGQVGFAGGFKSNRTPDKPAAPGGVRPIGL